MHFLFCTLGFWIARLIFQIFEGEISSFERLITLSKPSEKQDIVWLAANAPTIWHSS
jgi:hypothetical protein